MAARKSEVIWEGKLQTGQGTVKLGSGNFECGYSFDSRFQQGKGTNPEELIAAALAGCFSMALAHGLEKAGFTPERIKSSANAHIEKLEDGFTITKIELQTEANIPDINEDTFIKQAQAAKTNCPVSRALTGTEITLNAKLI